MRNSMVIVALGLILSVQAQQVYQALPTDDVWYYDNAFNPGFTTILRVWGTEQSAVDPTGAPPALNYSYSLARWSLAGIRPGVNYQVVSAEIRVTTAPPIGYTQQEGTDFPLEARDLTRSDFNEVSWAFANPNNPYPGNLIFGTGTMANYNPSAPFVIPIALTAPEFEAYFNSAINGNGFLGIGFVSRLDPGDSGGTRFYRFYSRNDTGGRGPVLRVVYRVAGDVNGDGCTDDADLLAVLFEFGNTGSGLPTDLNGDGIVDDADLLTVLFNFGNGC